MPKDGSETRSELRSSSHWKIEVPKRPKHINTTIAGSIRSPYVLFNRLALRYRITLSVRSFVSVSIQQPLYSSWRRPSSLSWPNGIPYYIVVCSPLLEPQRTLFVIIASHLSILRIDINRRRQSCVGPIAVMMIFSVGPLHPLQLPTTPSRYLKRALHLPMTSP